MPKNSSDDTSRAHLFKQAFNVYIRFENKRIKWDVSVRPINIQPYYSCLAIKIFINEFLICYNAPLVLINKKSIRILKDTL